MSPTRQMGRGLPRWLSCRCLGPSPASDDEGRIAPVTKGHAESMELTIRMPPTKPTPLSAGLDAVLHPPKGDAIAVHAVAAVPDAHSFTSPKLPPAQAGNAGMLAAAGRRSEIGDSEAQSVSASPQVDVLGMLPVKGEEGKEQADVEPQAPNVQHSMDPAAVPGASTHSRLGGSAVQTERPAGASLAAVPAAFQATAQALPHVAAHPALPHVRTKSGARASATQSKADASSKPSRPSKVQHSTPRPPSRANSPPDGAPSSPNHKLPPRSSLKPQPPSELAAAMRELAAVAPADPIAALQIVRAAALHSTGALGPQLAEVVPLLLRSLRAPRMSTARAAIVTIKELFLSYGDALCDHVADDTTPTSSALLALMIKATGADLNSRRIARDANECLRTMVESVSPATCISMLANYCMSAKVHTRIRSKAGALLVASAYTLAVTDVNSFDEGTMVHCLEICEALLMGGPSCRQVAKKLAVVVYSVFSQVPRSPCRSGEDAWSNWLRMQLEPEAALAVAEVVAQHASAGRQLKGDADLDGFNMDQPVKDMLSNLVLAAE